MDAAHSQRRGISDFLYDDRIVIFFGARVYVSVCVCVYHYIMDETIHPGVGAERDEIEIGIALDWVSFFFLLPFFWLLIYEREPQRVSHEV